MNETLNPSKHVMSRCYRLSDWTPIGASCTCGWKSTEKATVKEIAQEILVHVHAVAVEEGKHVIGFDTERPLVDVLSRVRPDAESEAWDE